MTSAAELTFGSVALLSPNPPWADYSIDACADGTDFGNPAATVAEVASMLMDGDKAQITRYGNRQAVIKIRVCGATLDAVAVGTALIEAEVNRGRNVLTWLPPGWSTASVFDVVYSTLDFNFDDLAEANQVERYFTLTLECLPFARRAEPTITVAAPVPTTAATVVSIDTCASTSGWSISSGWALSVVSGDLVASGSSATVAITRTGLSTSFSTGELLRLTMDTTSVNPDFFSVLVNGVVVSLAAAVPTIGTDAVYYYRVPAGTTLNSLEIRVPIRSGMSKVFKVRDVSRTNRMPTDGSTRQRSFIAELGGTARTTGNIVVEAVAPSTELGDDALIFTAPAATIAPPLRSYLTSSGTVSTSTPGTGPLLSGAWQDLHGTPSVYTIPSSAVMAGSYALLARMISSGTNARTVSWTATMSGSPWAGSVVESGSVDVIHDPAGKFVMLGVVDLPVVALSEDSGASIVITISGTGGTANDLDELYIANLDAGSLSWFDGLTTTGTPSRLAALSATVDSPRPQWIAGTAAMTKDDVSVAARMVSPGVHEVSPGTLNIFVATPLATSQSATVTAYERFGHHVPPLDS